MHAWPQLNNTVTFPCRASLQTTHSCATNPMRGPVTPSAGASAAAVPAVAAGGSAWRRCRPIICPTCDPTNSWTDWANMFSPLRNGTCCKTPLRTWEMPWQGALLAIKAPSPKSATCDKVDTKPPPLCSRARSSGDITSLSAPTAKPVSTFVPGTIKAGPATPPSTPTAPVSGSRTSPISAVSRGSTFGARSVAASLGTVILSNRPEAEGHRFNKAASCGRR
mmetsp:Transcript_8648/g.17756  ORF Transcript_8648/g.17756 Transcript_8648/m.17756 type:complete len:222 (-) Transcript_8648:119-784(-)